MCSGLSEKERPLAHLLDRQRAGVFIISTRGETSLLSLAIDQFSRSIPKFPYRVKIFCFIDLRQRGVKFIDKLIVGLNSLRVAQLPDESGIFGIPFDALDIMLQWLYGSMPLFFIER